MKTNLTRIVCLILVLMTAFSVFAGCSKEDDTTKTPTATDTPAVELQDDIIVEVDEDAPYAIAEDQEEIFLKAEDDGSIVLVVPEKTTVEALLKVVTAKDGYTVKVVDAEGKEVTDAATAVADKMVLNVVKDGEDTAEVTLTISVLTEKEIQSIQKEQQEVDKNNQNVPSTTSTTSKVNNTTNNNNNTNNTATTSETIVLRSIWISPYTASDATGQVWQSLFKTMKSKKGIETSIINLDGNTATDTIVKEAMAGKTDVDIYEVSAYIARCAARQGVLINLQNSKTLNKSLFSNAGTTSMTFGNNVYGVAIDYNATRPMGVIYNKDLIKKYASSYDIEKLYKEKKWTFETFKELAKACTVDTNGDNKPDVHGLTSNTNVIGMALTANAGGTALMKNGKVEATMCSDAGIAALEWMKGIYKDDKSWKYFASIKDSVNYFATGQSAMFASWLSYYTDIVAKANFDIGFVLMPIGPNQTDYITGQYDARFYIVPNTKADRLDVIGTWLNEVSGVSGKLINIELKNMARNGLDATAQNIYKWTMSNATPEYSSGVFSTDISSQVDSCVTASSKSPTKVMNSIKSKAQKELDDFFNPLY